MSPAARPTVDDVAALLRIRTIGSDVGEDVDLFNDDTHPTYDEVEEVITIAMGATATWPAVAVTSNNVAMYAAVVIEGSYYGQGADDPLPSLYRDLLARAGIVIRTGSASSGDEDIGVRFGPTKLA